MRCSNCGMDIPFEGKVCPHCGVDKSRDKAAASREFVGALKGGVAGLAVGVATGNACIGAVLVLVGLVIGGVIAGLSGDR